jgi:hypothetical protein
MQPTDMSKYFRNGMAAIAIAFFGGAIAMFPDHHCWALAFCGAATLLGLVVLIAGAISERRFRRTSKALTACLREADELFRRVVRDQSAYDKWVADLNTWHQGCNELLTNRLSPTHAALFCDVTGGFSVSVQGFNGEHMNYKNTLRKYIANLNGITNSYLRREFN